MKRTVLVALGVASAVLFAATVAQAAENKKGAKVFRKCAACHTIEEGKNKVGPSLAGVIGREAGSLDGFRFSSAMAESGVVWSAATLDEFLAKPKKFIKGTRMSFSGLKKEEDRKNVIEYIIENGGAAE